MSDEFSEAFPARHPEGCDDDGEQPENGPADRRNVQGDGAGLVSWGDAPGGEAESWALHASRRLPSAKVKAFMTYLETAFPNDWL